VSVRTSIFVISGKRLLFKVFNQAQKVTSFAFLPKLAGLAGRKSGKRAG
jgi:hypothetical protein